MILPHTDLRNYTNGSTNLYYEDSFTENQILLKGRAIERSCIPDLSQALFTIELLSNLRKLPKRPWRKENNAQEILKRKAKNKA
jgi:hypothetical protein